MIVLVLLLILVTAALVFGAWLFAPKWLGWSDQEGIGLWYGVGWVIPMTILGIVVGVAFNWRM